MIASRSGIVAAGIALTALLGSCAGAPESDRDLRAVWVTRWDYRTAEDVREIVRTCDEAGFDTLLFQVRGNATVFYRSSLEPWAEQLGWRDPGFDPLALAVELAHERGMDLHAWVNVVPAWWGPSPPDDPRHLYHTHPEWFWYDQHGERQALCDGFYVSLNPCLPEVRAYLVEVMEELVTSYELDGLHLDYIRFPNEHPAVPRGSGLDYPRDARTLALYRAETGRAPDDDAAAWNRWRAEQVTRLLREIRVALDRAAPDVVLGAAVGPEPERALDHFQDVETWLREGLVDLVFPMNYTADPDLFAQRLAAWADRSKQARVVMGLMASGATAELRRDQIRETARTLGDCALFGYHVLFDSRNLVLGSQTSAASRDRERLRHTILPALDR